MTTYTVLTTAVYRDATTNQAKRFNAGEIIPIEEAVRYGMPGAELPTAGSAFTAAQDAQLAAQESADSQTDHTHAGETESRTATADGTGTGAISSPVSGSVVVTVTSGNVNHIVTLPNSAIGDVFCLLPTATGYELRTHAPASVGINAGVGANAESAIPADTRVVAQRVTATNYVADNTADDGTSEPTEAAA